MNPFVTIEKADIPSVCVLLAAFNGGDWIVEQIDSILAQEAVDVFIYVSVDMSTDNTLSKIEELSASNEKIILLPSGERFGGAAKNFYRLIRDVDFSRFDFVAFADQDDIWMCGKLSRGVALIREADVSAFSSDVIAFWPDGKKSLIKKSYPRKKYDYLFEAAGPGCTYIFTSKSLLLFKDFLISKWGCVCSIGLHDWMLYAFFSQNNLKWHIDDVPLMLYRQHDGNQVGANIGFKALLKRLSMIKKHWYKGEVVKIAEVLNLERKSKWFMIANFRQLRRRSRDAFALLVMNIFFIY